MLTYKITNTTILSMYDYSVCYMYELPNITHLLGLLYLYYYYYLQKLVYVQAKLNFLNNIENTIINIIIKK